MSTHTETTKHVEKETTVEIKKEEHKPGAKDASSGYSTVYPRDFPHAKEAEQEKLKHEAEYNKELHKAEMRDSNLPAGERAKAGALVVEDKKEEKKAKRKSSKTHGSKSSSSSSREGKIRRTRKHGSKSSSSSHDGAKVKKTRTKTRKHGSKSSSSSSHDGHRKSKKHVDPLVAAGATSGANRATVNPVVEDLPHHTHAPALEHPHHPHSKLPQNVQHATNPTVGGNPSTVHNPTVANPLTVHNPSANFPHQPQHPLTVHDPTAPHRSLTQAEQNGLNAGGQYVEPVATPIAVPPIPSTSYAPPQIKPHDSKHPADSTTHHGPASAVPVQNHPNQNVIPGHKHIRPDTQPAYDSTTGVAPVAAGVPSTTGLSTVHVNDSTAHPHTVATGEHVKDHEKIAKEQEKDAKKHQAEVDKEVHKAEMRDPDVPTGERVKAGLAAVGEKIKGVVGK